MRHKTPRARVLHYNRGLQRLGRGITTGALWTLAALCLIPGLVALAILALWGIAEVVTALF